MPSRVHIAPEHTVDEACERRQEAALQLRREWMAQRAGWGGIALLVLTASTGVLGMGPVSGAEARSGSGLVVSYVRFARADSPNELQIFLPPTQADHQDILLDGNLLEVVRIDSIMPTPLELRTTREGMTAVFRTTPSEKGVVSIHYVVSRSGVFSASVARAHERATPASFKVYALP